MLAALKLTIEALCTTQIRPIAGGFSSLLTAVFALGCRPRFGQSRTLLCSETATPERFALIH
jgi:hypothetical protein